MAKLLSARSGSIQGRKSTRLRDPSLDSGFVESSLSFPGGDCVALAILTLISARVRACRGASSFRGPEEGDQGLGTLNGNWTSPLPYPRNGPFFRFQGCI